MSLSLGGVTFTGFECPEELPFGGKQRIAEHQVIGGSRTVDAMGPTPEVISWHGRFRGADALSRAQELDSMRQSGAEVDLSWESVYYTVVISHFVARPNKSYEVPYEIEVVVVDDPSLGGAGGLIGALASSLDSLVSGDMVSAISSFSGVLGNVSGIVGNVVSVVGSTSGIIGAVSNAAGSLSSSISALGF